MSLLFNFMELLLFRCTNQEFIAWLRSFMCSYVVLNKQANAPLTRPKVHIIPRKMKHIYNGYKKEGGGGGCICQWNAYNSYVLLFLSVTLG
jgi:hypothetical protein